MPLKVEQLVVLLRGECETSAVLNHWMFFLAVGVAISILMTINMEERNEEE